MSAGQVFNPSAEAATGRINEVLLETVARLTGGDFVAAGRPPDLSLRTSEVARYVELWPWLMMVFIPLALADLLIRRWEHARGLVAAVRPG